LLPLPARRKWLRGRCCFGSRSHLLDFTGQGMAKAGFDPTRIRIRGAREHNLRSVDLELPKGRLICFTGVSGSGKSSLAFDTITQIHDYMRVLYARAGLPHCPNCGNPITAQPREQMLVRILALPRDTRIWLLGPKIRAQKGEYKDLFAELLQQGFLRARVDGRFVELADPPKLDRYRRHDIEVVVDRLSIRQGVRPRLAESLELALGVGNGSAIVVRAVGEPGGSAAGRPSRRTSGDILLSSAQACTRCAVSYEPLSPQMFSFNSPQGMCAYCDGLGTRYDFDPGLLIPDPSKSLLTPCVVALRRPPGRWQRHIYEGVARHVGCDATNLTRPWNKLPVKLQRALLHGTGDEHITFEWRGRRGTWLHGGTFEGIIAELNARYRKTASAMVRRYYEQFMRHRACPHCNGARLNPQALAVTLESNAAEQPLNVHEVCDLPIRRASAFFEGVRLEGARRQIAEEPLKEIRARLQFLVDVGLDYLTLNRAAPTLAGGESQRIRLASQIGSGLVGVLYVLDEPSIGLHPRDNRRLLASLQRLRDLGNTVIVVEHDRDTMEAADLIVDFGPGPGIRGGRIVAAGDLPRIASNPDSVTGAFLSGRERIEVPAARRPITSAPPQGGRGKRRRPTGRQTAPPGPR
jgi:excinuclease ABC subunit A